MFCNIEVKQLKKVFLILIIFVIIIIIGFIFIFGNKNENRKNDNKNDNKISSELNIVPSDTYTIVNSLVGELKFKTASKTKFWSW